MDVVLLPLPPRFSPCHTLCITQVERLDDLVQHVDDKNFARTCLYLVSCCSYLPEPDDQKVLEVAHAIYSKVI